MRHLVSIRLRLLSSALAGLALASCGGGNGGGNGGGGMSPTPVPNRPPVFTSPATSSIAENSTGTVYTAAATDADGNNLTYSISGGADRALFAITGAGALSFVASPDFEMPRDANGDNVYLVEISVSDGTATTMLALSITVTNVGNDAFRVRRVSTAFNQPVYLTAVPDGSGKVFVVERGGRIRVLTPSTGVIDAQPLLDVSSEISTDGERGLLGFAPAPDYISSRVFYVYLTNRAGNIEIRRYPGTLVLNQGSAITVNAPPEILLTIPHSSASNHNGGWIDFGPDGFLYIAVGDGGGQGDPNNNGQNKNVLLGKMLRIDVSRDGFPNDNTRNYAIPAGNPFASSGGAPEIWAYGLRNPFRDSFDRTTGSLLIADVGENAIEEIDLMRPTDGGANFGWSQIEGTQAYKGPVLPAYTLPVAEYSHGTGTRQGNSITGGYVYRGPIEGFRGQYFFADYVRGNIWSVPLSRLVPGSTLSSSQFTIRNADFTPNAGVLTSIVSFGEDETRNLYIVDIVNGIFVVEPAG